MDVRSLKLFLTLADTLSFSRTSELCHLSLSAVSRKLQKLEEEVGQRLFERDKRTVRLSPAGLRFLDYAETAVADWDSILSEFQPEQGQLTGEIRVYGSVTASYSLLSPILERFRPKYPQIEILLHTGDQADAIERVYSGTDDVSVAACPDDLSTSLEFLVLQQAPLQFIVPTLECALSKQVAQCEQQGEIAWDELPFVMAERGLSRYRLDQWFAKRRQKPRIYAQVAGHEAIAAMVALGLGVGVVPELVLEKSAFRDQLRTVPVELPLQAFPVGLCSLGQRLENPLVAAFWQEARLAYGIEA